MSHVPGQTTAQQTTTPASTRGGLILLGIIVAFTLSWIVVEKIIEWSEQKEAQKSGTEQSPSSAVAYTPPQEVVWVALPDSGKWSEWYWPPIKARERRFTGSDNIRVLYKDGTDTLITAWFKVKNGPVRFRGPAGDSVRVTYTF